MGRQSHSKFKFQYLNLRQMFAGRKSLLYNFLCHVLNEKKTFKKSSDQFLTRMNIKYICFISITSQSELTFISHVLFLLNSRVSNRCMNWCLSALSIRICLLSENFTPMDGNSIRMLYTWIKYYNDSRKHTHAGLHAQKKYIKGNNSRIDMGNAKHCNFFSKLQFRSEFILCLKKKIDTINN